ncbi:hypothetical protein IQ235_17900 [Oscillatoriales cyanobacterium LEGE 11467]|uniref:Uncharacterized protein n=1 Tax=Zarconia navalis LEGE 11467 TaxID=1828826 RepID=A0A928ZAF4_9CYAN|nr:hypothetical protein [Zarconia navalis]MBE9042638.1 hypothetical protein [Zarconia navalis LEGE 11467]
MTIVVNIDPPRESGNESSYFMGRVWTVPKYDPRTFYPTVLSSLGFDTSSITISRFFNVSRHTHSSRKTLSNGLYTPALRLEESQFNVSFKADRFARQNWGRGHK